MNKITKNILLLIIFGLVIVLISKALDTNNDAADDADEISDNAGAEKIHIVDGYKAVQLDNEIVSTAGIQFEHLSAMVFTPEFSAYAEVLDISPLVMLKTEHVNLLAEKDILKIDLKHLDRTLQRAEGLHRIKSLATGELEKNRADRDVKVAELRAMNTRLESLTYRINSSWGQLIGDLVLDQKKQADFDSLASHQTLLILVSLLKNQTLGSPEQQVFVSSTSRRNAAQSARYIDRANQSSNPLYGESYIYSLESPKLRPGMRLFAWIKDSGEDKTGLFLPETAVIWYANEPWIYVTHSDNVFVRKPLGNAIKLEDGWLLNKGQFDNDVLVVTRGGQSLLSEEFKWAIPDEDDD